MCDLTALVHHTSASSSPASTEKATESIIKEEIRTQAHSSNGLLGFLLFLVVFLRDSRPVINRDRASYVPWRVTDYHWLESEAGQLLLNFLDSRQFRRMFAAKDITVVRAGKDDPSF